MQDIQGQMRATAWLVCAAVAVGAACTGQQAITPIADQAEPAWLHWKYLIKDDGVIEGRRLEDIPIANNPEGVLIAYSNAVVLSETPYSNGMWHGAMKTYWQSGALREEVWYRLGKEEGSFRQWYPDGAITLQGTRKDGSFDGALTNWYADGFIRSREEYANGELLRIEWGDPHIYKIKNEVLGAWKTRRTGADVLMAERVVGLVDAGQSQEAVIHMLGAPDGRQQRGESEIFSYGITDKESLLVVFGPSNAVVKVLLNETITQD